MEMQKAFVTCICLCGTFFLAESWQPSGDTNAFFKTLSQSRGIKAATVHLPGNDGGQNDFQNYLLGGRLTFDFCFVSVCITLVIEKLNF